MYKNYFRSYKNLYEISWTKTKFFIIEFTVKSIIINFVFQFFRSISTSFNYLIHYVFWSGKLMITQNVMLCYVLQYATGMYIQYCTPLHTNNKLACTYIYSHWISSQLCRSLCKIKMFLHRLQETIDYIIRYVYLCLLYFIYFMLTDYIIHWSAF